MDGPSQFHDEEGNKTPPRKPEAHAKQSEPHDLKTGKAVIDKVRSLVSRKMLARGSPCIKIRQMRARRQVRRQQALIPSGSAGAGAGATTSRPKRKRPDSS